MAGPPVLGFVKKVVDDKKVSRDSFFLPIPHLVGCVCFFC